ncbi:hypothetical protein JYU20_00645 [Bacteroidales bacterium AH-315-I05]|nr:hypothetical protein [Bacteroidales bacterium AH-315-I05]
MDDGGLTLVFEDETRKVFDYRYDGFPEALLCRQCNKLIYPKYEDKKLRESKKDPRANKFMIDVVCKCRFLYRFQTDKMDEIKGIKT